MSPASNQPSVQHNGSTADITMSLPSAPDCDLRTDGNAKFPATAVPPKKPLTPYMKFSKSVSVCLQMSSHLLKTLLIFCNTAALQNHVCVLLS